MITSNLHYRIHFFKKAARKANLRGGQIKIMDVDNIITINGRIKAVLEFKERANKVTLYAIPEFEWIVLKNMAETFNADLILLFFDFHVDKYWLCHYKAGEIPFKQPKYTKKGWFVFFGKGEGKYMTMKELLNYFAKLFNQWKRCC